jgi:hypothetical protein
MELYLHPFNVSSWCGAYLSNEYIFMAWYLVKHGDSLVYFMYFTLLPFNAINVTAGYLLQM